MLVTRCDLKKFLISFTICFLAMFSISQTSYAQEITTGPVYVVKEGDNLTSIAIRFGVTVQALVETNNLPNANALRIGDRLVIPGLEGISGVLETRTIPFGENLRSLSRTYQIPIETLVRLNRLVSPVELVVGAPLVLPVSENETSRPGRTTLASGESLLEKSVLTGTNLWAITQYNKLPSPTSVLPGDMLLIAGQTSEGPAGLPVTVLNATLTRFGQGQTGVIKIITSEPVLFSGTLDEYALHFFEINSNEYAAMQGIYALAQPGMKPLEIIGILPSGQSFAFSQMVYVDDRAYIFEFINVPPEFIDPENTAAESAFVTPFVETASPEKLWQGTFAAPSPFKDCINSTFGNRRSYNGSAFDYFHGGVDFCGGEGTQIYAPATGKVVFAGTLEIRGNYTLIDHGWGVFSGYMHQSAIQVKEGDIVNPGQLIGLVGNTGRSTEPHLHWEIWVGGQLVNPLDWLAREYP